LHFQLTGAARVIEALEPRTFLSRTILVDVTATGPTHDGTSWTTAYNDLQAALTSAIPGDEIRVADGTYYPTATTDRTKTLQLKNGVSIFGGYAGYGDAAPDSRDVTLNQTILSGNIGSAAVSTDNSYRIVTGSGTTASAVLDGFTIRDGNANGASPYISGAGLFNSSGSPTIRTCRFLNNAANNGGAVLNTGSSPQFVECEFSGNSAVSAGGINNVLGSSPSFSSCTFSQNVSMNAGGAVSNDTNCNPTFVGCSFDSNSATLRGGAVYSINTSAPSFTDCSFTGNSVTSNSGFAGAIYNSHTVSTLLRCEFTGNTSAGDAGALYADFSTPSGLDWNMTDCVFVRNSTADEGGVMYANARVRALRCAFYGNSAWRGGAVSLNNHSFEFTNCIFVGNVAGSNGGAALVTNSGSLFSNCTFANNAAPSGGGGAIYRGGGSSTSPIILRNSILWGNTASHDPAMLSAAFTPAPVITNTDFQGGTSGTGNIDADPLLRRTPNEGPDGVWMTVDDDYGDLRLQSASPAIDAGDNTFVPSGVTTDFDGNPRTIDVPGPHDPGAIVDMGAHEKTLPLTIIVDSLTTDRTVPTLILTFSSAVQQSSLSAADVTFYGAQTYSGDSVVQQVSYDPATYTASFALNALPSGNYRASIQMNAVLDSAGDGLAQDHDASFFIFAADGDHNRAVDIQDFNLLAVNFGTSGKSFSQGNYDYSPDGKVTILDFNVLATNFGKHLDPPAGSSAVSAPLQTVSLGEVNSTSPSQGWLNSSTDDTNLLSDIGLV
jgi:predicted outer membrane repeat protein